jgi:homoserine dehydrogenase
MSIKPSNVGIVGAGNVGAAIANALVLLGKDEDEAKSELSHPQLARVRSSPKAAREYHILGERRSSCTVAERAENRTERSVELLQ